MTVKTENISKATGTAPPPRRAGRSDHLKAVALRTYSGHQGRRMSDDEIVQLLPMNDVGFDFRPYDAQSMFALEPVYLSLNHLKGVDRKEEAQGLGFVFEHEIFGIGKMRFGKSP